MTILYFKVGWYKICLQRQKTKTGVEFDTVSYNIFMEMAGEEHIDKESGIMMAQSDDFFDNDILPEVTNPWHKDVVYNVSSSFLQ